MFKQLAFYGIISFIAILILFPVLVAFQISLTPSGEIFIYPPKLISNWNIRAYVSVFSQSRYLRYFLNGYIISFFSILLSICLGGLAAYGLSRFRLPGKKIIMLGILSLQMFPGAVMFIPYFNLSKFLNIYNTYFVLIIINTTLSLPLVIWLLKSFFDSIPVAIEEAALIDGCSRLKAILYILVPIIKTGFIAVSIFAFKIAWNEFMFSFILTDGPKKAPVTVGLSELIGQYSLQWNQIMALTIVAVAPVILLFIFTQRYMISGMTGGAIK